MLESLHTHMVSEVQQSSRTDTVFVITGVLFNLFALGISWAVAQPHPDHTHPAASDAILAILVMLTVAVNAMAIRGLASGRDRMQRLLAGLTRIYEDSGVGKYYDPQLLQSYRVRYSSFIGVLGALAAAALVVPLLQRLLT